MQRPPPSPWSRLQDKLFERALAAFPEGSGDRWERVAAEVPGKSTAEVQRHYGDLVHDVAEIDSGRVEPPRYRDEADWAAAGQRGDPERKKGVPWTEEEHRLFLMGLHKYGKGDWRSISRKAVVTRTPTQVASHAQKYYLRLKAAPKKEKRRPSIHDVDAGAGAGAGWVQAGCFFGPGSFVPPAGPMDRHRHFHDPPGGGVASPDGGYDFAT